MKVSLLIAVLAATASLALPLAPPAPQPSTAAKPGRCRPMTISELRQMKPLFNAIVQSAGKEGGLESIHVNLPTLSQFPATICTDGSQAEYQKLKPQACTTASTSTSDTGGAEGKLTTEVSTGYKTSTTVTESTSTMVGAGLGVSLNTNFGTDLGINSSIDYTRGKGSSKTSETDSSVSSTREVTVKDGGQCSITTQTKNCMYNVQGQYPVFASGHVHLKYKNKPQMSMFKIDDLNPELRKERISIQVAIDTKTDIGVTAICKDGNQVRNIPVSGTAMPQQPNVPVSGTPLPQQPIAQTIPVSRTADPPQPIVQNNPAAISAPAPGHTISKRWLKLYA